MQLNGHLSGISLSDVKAAGNHHWKGNVYQQEYLNRLTEVKADKKKKTVKVCEQLIRTLNKKNSTALCGISSSQGLGGYDGKY